MNRTGCQYTIACCVWVWHLLSGVSALTVVQAWHACLTDLIQIGRRGLPIWCVQNSILTPTTSQHTRKRLLCAQQCPQKHLHFSRICWPGKWQTFRRKKWKRRINSITRENGIFSLRLEFIRTVQQEAQSITDFLAELRNKSKECDFDFEEQCCVKCQDNALRVRLVTDCRRTIIQQALLEEGVASLTNVLQCAKMAKLLSIELWKMQEFPTDHTTGHTQQEVHSVHHSQPSRQKQHFRDNNALVTPKGAMLTSNLT